MPSGFSTPKPACATAAPASPPTIAWEEEVGIPPHHVRRSHAIAPTSPAAMTGIVTDAGETTPCLIVEATASPKTRNAMKLKKAAHATARCGERTRVETIVAIELAASWKPLMKSNARASPMIAQTRESDILEHDPLDDVRHVLAAVG